MSDKVQALELAGLGFNPFRPDVGIFCGGFQGPLYPNPTTLFIKNLENFDAVLFQKPTSDLYKLNKYNGLGKGNPGSNIRNPGHFLGIMDTFYRMSYGLKVLDTLRKAETDVSDPIIDIVIPLILLQSTGTRIERVDAEFSIDQLYSKLTEIPSDYINNFDVDNPNYIPKSNLNKTMFDIFLNITIKEGYINLVKTLRTTLQDLQTEAKKFETRKHYFIISPPTLENRDPLWHPLTQFESFMLGHNFPQRPDNKFTDSQGTYLSQHKSLSVDKAVKLINQDGEFHGEVDPQIELLDYRSVTELNGVINLLPIQVHSRSEAFHPSIDDGVADILTLWFFRFWTIISLNLNVTAQQQSSITIEGTISLDVDGNNERYWTTERGVIDTLTFDSACNNQRGSGDDERYIIQHKITSNIKAVNDFTWDKVWFGLPSTTFDVSDEIRVEENGLEQRYQIIFGNPFSLCGFFDTVIPPKPILWENKPQITELQIDETIPLKLGCNNITGTFIAGSVHWQSDIAHILVDPSKPGQLKFETIKANITVKDEQGNIINALPDFQFETSYFPAEDEDGNPLGDA